MSIHHLRAACRASLLGVLVAPVFALSVSTPAQAADKTLHVQIDCKAAGAECPPPPPPPPPPVPPRPPRPPVGHGDESQAPPPAHLPASPPVPAVHAGPLPALPSLPTMPPVPPAANAACAGQVDGQDVVIDLRPGETMRGQCAKRDGKMVFQLRRHEING